MKTRLTTIAGAAALALLSLPSQAVPVDFGAYFRSAAGSSSEGGNLVCYRLPGASVWFRLGNECDSYVDLKFGATVGQVDGTTFKAKFTISNGTQGLANWEQYSPALREAFVEAQDVGAGLGIPALKGASLWVGKRFYKNPNIHMLDYTFWEPAQGPGAGIDGIDAGGVGKFSYAYLRLGDGAGYGINPNLGGWNPDLIGGGTRTVTVHDFRLSDIATNPGGKATVGLDLVRANNRSGTSTYTVESTQMADLDNNPATPMVPVVIRETRTLNNKPGKNGVGLTFTHEQADPFGLGGNNTVGLQIARNAAALKGFGFVGTTADRKEWLLFDHWYFAPKGSRWSATSTAGYRHTDIDGKSEKEFWVGARPVYDLNNIWSLFAEAGYQEVKPEGEATRKLGKLTLGTAVSMGPGVWARPSLRFFVTYAKWNDAAAAGGVARAGRDANSIADGFANKRSAVSYGAQVEAWF